ncbi:MAG: FAD-dependent oxidoreductase, partial [Aedoeadaptatus pacaensis]
MDGSHCKVSKKEHRRVVPLKKYDYLILGSGVAGVTAAKEIRKKDKEGSILLLGNENERPYFRIELTACLSEENP